MKEWLISFTDRPLVATVLTILSLALCFILGLAVVSTVLDLYQKAHETNPPANQIESVTYHGADGAEIQFGMDSERRGSVAVWLVGRMLIVACDGKKLTLYTITEQEAK